jgi:3-deoxy-manno-octulosonate cytidylyltransferase (CMP-KDO synthetase)
MPEWRIMKKVLGVIPARFGSTRLPGKPLALIHGKPMIQWVYDAAYRALGDVVVATDDKRVMDTVAAFGGLAMMTPRSCNSGTERMAAVARKRAADIYVNIQGDEPMMSPKTIKETVKLSLAKRAIATPAIKLDPADANNPNAVKVVLGDGDRAVYFSRSLIPFPRDGAFKVTPLKHLGLYAYPRKELLKFVSLKPTALEQTEMLEQLRALYHGLPIFVARTAFDSVGVDTPADLAAVTQRLR